MSQMNLKKILKGLSAEQRDQEKTLRLEVYKELKTHRDNRKELGRLLTKLHDEVVGEKKFKYYLDYLGIARRSAYRWREIYRLLEALPESIVRAAEKRRMDLCSDKYRDSVKAMSYPKNPTQAEADEWLDAVEARQKESAAKLDHSPDPSELGPEERNQLTSEACSKHCKQLGSFVDRYWPDIPAEERSIEVAQAVMGVTAAKLGIRKPFKVIPNERPELVERLEEKIAQEEEVEEAVVA